MTSLSETFTSFVTEFDQLSLSTGHKTPEFMKQIDLASRCNGELTKERFEIAAALFICALHHQYSTHIPNLEADDSINLRRDHYNHIQDHPLYQKKLHLLATYDIVNDPKQETISCYLVPSKSRQLYIPITQNAMDIFVRHISEYDFADCNDKSKNFMVQFLVKEELVEDRDYVKWYVNPISNVTDQTDIYTGFYGIVPLYTRMFLHFFRHAIANIIYKVDGVKLQTFNCVNNQILHAVQRDHMFIFTEVVNQMISGEQYKTLVAKFGRQYDFKEKYLDLARQIDLRFAPFFNGVMITEVTKILGNIISKLKEFTGDDKSRDEIIAHITELLVEYRAENDQQFIQLKEQMMDFVVDEWYAAKERRKTRLAAQAITTDFE